LYKNQTFQILVLDSKNKNPKGPADHTGRKLDVVNEGKQKYGFPICGGMSGFCERLQNVTTKREFELLYKYQITYNSYAVLRKRNPSCK